MNKKMEYRINAVVMRKMIKCIFCGVTRVDMHKDKCRSCIDVVGKMRDIRMKWFEHIVRRDDLETVRAWLDVDITKITSKFVY